MTIRVRAEITVEVRPPEAANQAEHDFQEALRTVKITYPCIERSKVERVTNRGAISLVLEIVADDVSIAEDYVYEILDELTKSIPCISDSIQNSDKYLTTA